MGLLQKLRGIARDQRPPPPSATPRPVDVACNGVEDHAVLGDYRLIAARAFDTIHWGEPETPRERTLALFEVPGALTTRGYLCVDPARGRIFLNTGYRMAAEQFTQATLPDGRLPVRAPAPIDVAGTALLLGGPYDRNYYHGVMNWAVRVALVRALAPQLLADRSITILLDRCAGEPPFRPLFEALGVPLDRVMWTDEAADYRIERAIVPSFLDERELCGDLVRGLVAEVRRALGIPRPDRASRRIWISREHHPEDRRRVANMAEIAPVLDRHGVETVVLDGLPFADQVRLFGEAALVTGSHGAGYVNAIFCRPDAQLLIVENEFTQFLKIYRLFTSLADTVGVASEIVVGRTIRRPGRDYSTFVDHHQADVDLDPALLDAALRRHLGEARE